VPKAAEKALIEKVALDNENVKKIIGLASVKKCIVVEHRLINIIV
jgi:leucyl-tRNA synthetase